MKKAIITPEYGNLFEKMRAPEDIRSLLEDILAQPSRFTPKSIRSAFAYAQPAFKNIHGPSKIKEEVLEVPKKEYSEVYRIEVNKSESDQDVFISANIEFVGIRLDESRYISRRSLDFFSEAIYNFNPWNQLSFEERYQSIADNIIKLGGKKTDDGFDDVVRRFIEEDGEELKKEDIRIILTPNISAAFTLDVFEGYRISITGNGRNYGMINQPRTEYVAGDYNGQVGLLSKSEDCAVLSQFIKRERWILSEQHEGSEKQRLRLDYRPGKEFRIKNIYDKDVLLVAKHLR